MRRFDARARVWLLLIAAVGLLFCGGFVLAPWMESHQWTAGPWLRLGYRPTCHQIPSRCLDLGDGPLAVCARCAGLYLGGLAGMLAGSLLGVRFRPRLIWVAAALAPSVVDFTLALTGLPSLSNWPRAIVAVPPGLLLGLLFADAVGDVVGRIGPPPSEAGGDLIQ